MVFGNKSPTQSSVPFMLTFRCEIGRSSAACIVITIVVLHTQHQWSVMMRLMNFHHGLMSRRWWRFWTWTGQIERWQRWQWDGISSVQITHTVVCIGSILIDVIHISTLRISMIIPSHHIHVWSIRELESNWLRLRYAKFFQPKTYVKTCGASAAKPCRAGRHTMGKFFGEVLLVYDESNVRNTTCWMNVRPTSTKITRQGHMSHKRIWRCM